MTQMEVREQGEPQVTDGQKNTGLLPKCKMPVDKEKLLTVKCLHDPEHSGSMVKQTGRGSREDPTAKDIC